jgi:hypothetical protein
LAWNVALIYYLKRFDGAADVPRGCGFDQIARLCVIPAAFIERDKPGDVQLVPYKILQF